MTERTVWYRGIQFTFPDMTTEALVACPDFAWCVYRSFLDEKTVSCAKSLEDTDVKVDCGAAARVRRAGNSLEVIVVQGQRAACVFMNRSEHR